MLDEALSQAGLATIYLVFSCLMALLQRLEKSKAIRFWTLAFLFFAVDAGVSSLRCAFELPDYTRVISWAGLWAGALIAFLGTLDFLGKSPSKWFLFLAGGLAVFLALGTALGVDVDLIRPLIFLAIGALFGWIGILVFRAGIRGGAGRWVAASAFITAALYASLWPLLRQVDTIAKMEFFLDLVVLIWGANGVLLMHFDQAREQIRKLAAQELALKEKLAQAERIDALGRLAAGVAHDFNNVLTTVINGSELVLRQFDEREKAEKRLRMVIKAAKGSVGFTRQLLALGRRHLPGQKSTCLRDGMEAALQIIDPSLLTKIKLKQELPPEDLAIRAADGQIEQIIVNLALNAQDAMPNGGELRITAAPLPDDGSTVRLTVKDSGVGMDEKTKAHLFDPFYSTKKQNGTGLGLAAVYAIIQQLNGEIFVDSHLGKGTTFTIDLPLCSISSPAEPAYHTSFNPSDVRILVVDDDNRITSTVTDGLKAAGFVAKGHCDPEYALGHALKEPPDVLLSDVCMPSMQGPDLAEQILKKHPDVRVIMMSGVAQTENDKDRLKEARWLAKPVTIKTLAEAIQEVLLGRPPVALFVIRKPEQEDIPLLLTTPLFSSSLHRV